MAGFLKNVVKSVGKYIDDAEERVYGVDAPDAEVTIDGNKIVVKGAPEAEIENLKAGIFEDEPDFGFNFGKVGDQLDLLDPNYNTIELMQTLKANNEELFQRARRGSIPIEELIKMAESIGADEIAARFLKRKPGEVLNAEEFVGGFLLAKKLGLEATEAINRSHNLHGDILDEMDIKIKVLVGFQKNILASLSGTLSESARTMAVSSNIQKVIELGLKDEFARAEQFMENVDKGLFKYAKVVYGSLPTNKRQRFLRTGFAAKTWDAAMEAYVNALVSAVPTHMVNIAGNAIFQGMTLSERSVAGVIGAVRTLDGRRGAPGDYVHLGEAAAEAHGLLMSQGEAIALSAKTFFEGQSPDLMSKIDLFAGTDTRRAIGSTDNLKKIYDMAAQGDISGFSTNALGVAVRLPGRFLATEDEYFKVITRRRVLHREAYIRGRQAFEAARMEGMSRADAKDFAAAEYASIIASPPKDVTEIMRQESLVQTFQNEPEGILGTGILPQAAQKAPSILQAGPMRVIVPYYKTPQNVINAIADRTFNIYPLMKAIASGSGKEYDMALAKLAVGNSIFFTFAGIASGYFGDDIILTGSGPIDDRIDKLRDAADIPNYSVGVKQKDGSYEFATYSRLDPLSGVIAMAVDYARYARTAPDDQSTVEFIGNLAMHGVLGASEYALSMPFLEGVSEIVKGAYDPHATTKIQTLEKITNYLGKKTGDLAMTVGGSVLEPPAAIVRDYGIDVPTLGTTPFQATLKRYTDPVKRSKILEEGEYFDPFSMSYKEQNDLPWFMKGFYNSYVYAKSRSPVHSKNLEPELNFWGQEMTEGTGHIADLISPIMTKDGYYDKFNIELERLADIGAGAFKRHPRRIQANNSGNFDLNSKQYNGFIRIINEIDANGNLPDDEFYDPSTNLISSLYDTANSQAYSDAFDDSERYGMLSNIVSNRRLAAKKRLIASDPSLNLLMGEQ